MSPGPFIPVEADALRTGGAAFARLLEASRTLLDAVAAFDGPANLSDESALELLQIAAVLAPHGVSRLVSPAGNRADLPGEGHPSLVPTEIDSWQPGEVTGRVTFTRAHDGGGNAVHGGFVPLLFDDVLGRLAARFAPRSRTAFLHIDFRSITPVGRELTLHGRIDRTEGRKLFASGELREGDRVLAEATALFLILLPGQP